MKKYFYLALIFCLAVPVPVCAAEAGQYYRVTRVIDGDSLMLEGGSQVRLLGIDAPEVSDKHGRNRRNALRFGANPDSVKVVAITAKETLQKWAEGKLVRIEFAPENSRSNHLDDYGRLLAYLYLENEELSLNGAMIKEGQAFAYRKFKHAQRTDFMRYEREAKLKRKGMWL